MTNPKPDDGGEMKRARSQPVSTPKSAAREAEPSAAVHPAACYTIRTGWAWAHIFVRHGVGAMHDGSPRHWVNVAVISDFGSFGYCWTHIGPGPWQDFLGSLNQDYALGKLMGSRYRCKIDGHEAAEKARGLVLGARRQGDLSRDSARTLWGAIDDSTTDEGASAFLKDWDRYSDGLMYRHALYEANWETVSPQATGFWSEIWPHFIAALSSEASPLGAELGSNENDRGREELSRLQHSLALAVEALGPFARAPHEAVRWDGEKHVPVDHPDSAWAPVFNVTRGDLRRAREAYATLTSPEKL